MRIGAGLFGRLAEINLEDGDNMHLFSRVAFVVSLLCTIALITYLVLLGTRTLWFQRCAAVGGDVALFVAAICILAIASSLAAWRRGIFGVPLSRALVLLNATTSLVYLTLYVLGKFGPIGPKS